MYLLPYCLSYTLLTINKHSKNMKKTYMTPSMEEMYVETVEMLAASMGMYDEDVDTSEDQKGRRRGQWGDLWYEGEEE